MEILRKSGKERLDIRSTGREMESCSDGLSSLDTAEERNSQLGNTSIASSKTKSQKEQRPNK